MLRTERGAQGVGENRHCKSQVDQTTHKEMKNGEEEVEEGEEGEEEEEGEISPMCESIGHRPLRGRCPKSVENTCFPTFQLNHHDRRTDQRTDKASYRVACPQLLRGKLFFFSSLY